MKLITGHSGFLANNLIEKLNFEDLIVTGRSNVGISNFIEYKELIKSNLKFSTIFHLASYIPNKTEIINDNTLFEANVKLTSDLIQKIDFEKFIFASSVSVYGNCNNIVINEFSNLNSPSNYGISKFWAEKIVESNKNHSIVRFSSIFGEGMKETTLIPIYVNQALNDGIITVWGDGSRLQNYLYVSDASDILLKAASSCSTGVFLGIGSKSYSNLNIAEMIAAYTNAKIIFKGEDLSKSFTYNNSKTQETLEWYPKIDIMDGLKNYIKWKEKQF